MHTQRDGDVRFWESESLEEHVALIKRQIDRSLQDPELPELVRRVVMNDVSAARPSLSAWGSTFVVPKDAPCQPETAADRAELALMRIWNFVSLNWSYIEDPPGFDLFAHIKWNMNARAHARELEKLRTEDPATTRLLADHIKRLRGVKTAGAGDCDDGTIVFGAMLKRAGFCTVRARVVSIDAETYAHVYTVVGTPMKDAVDLIPLDPTVRGAVPGWEYSGSKVVDDFDL